MAEWRSRVLAGAGLLFLTPISAHLANSAASHADDRGTGSEGPRYRQNVQTTGAATIGGNAPVADLTSADVARAVTGHETEQDFRGTLCSFLVLYGGSKPVESGVKAAGRTAAADGKGEICTDPAPSAVEAMIAIVPDPVRTHLALRFDRAMDDIESSAQPLGWRFHKAWLPWANTEPPSASRLHDKYIDEQMTDKREDQPGLLLFRNEEARKPLVILVVGDTPTGGVNAEQFRKAVAVWKSLHTTDACPVSERGRCVSSRERMMVLGPTFSGSLPSLRSLIDESFAQPPLHGPCEPTPIEVAVASGTISSGQDMQKLWDLDGTCNSRVNAIPVSFGEDITYVRTHLLRFLNDHLARKDSGIAELFEAESQFGARAGEDQLPIENLKLAMQQQERAKLTELRKELNSLLTEDPKDANGNSPEQKKRDLIASIKSLEESTADRAGAIREESDLIRRLKYWNPTRVHLRFTFPRGISLLRKAYEQNGILGFGQGRADTPKTQLQLNFQESANGDAVASFSGNQGASSMESRMAQIAATLEKDKIGVAVLSATDVLDTIFVARYLRAHAPSITIVIQDADLLFLRGGSDTSLDGIYVVSPYPLIPRNSLWSMDRDSPLVNPPMLAESQGDQGMVNAATYLLCGGDSGRSVSEAGQFLCGWKPREGFAGEYLWLPEYEAPFPVQGTAETPYKLHPPLWLSVIGHGGFQPVSLIDLDQQSLGLPASSAGSKEASALSLPELGAVSVNRGGAASVPATRPAGIRGEPLTQLYVVTALLFLVLGLHAWACTRCRLDRAFAWSYAAADEKPWLKRLLVQGGVNLLGIYALSLVLIHDMDGMRLERLRFKIVVVLAQMLLVLLTGAVAWRSAAGGRNTRRHAWLTVTAVLVSGAFLILADAVFPNVFAPNATLSAERTLFFYRSAYVLNGACPALPLFLLTCAVALWLRGRLAKLVFYGYRIPRLPSGGEEFRCPCNEKMSDLNRLLGEPLLEGRDGKKVRVNQVKLTIAAVSIGMVALVLLLSRQAGPHSLAFSRFDEEVDVIAFLVTVAIVHNLLTAGMAWHMLKRECLTPLRQSPLRWGFNWIRGFSWKRLLTSPEGFTPEAELEYVVRNVEADRRGLAAHCPSSPLHKAYEELLAKYDSHDTDIAQCSFWQRAGTSAKWAEGLAQTSRKLYGALADEADQRLLRLRTQWRADAGPVTGPDTTRGLHMERRPEEEKDDTLRQAALQRMADEEFAALVYITYIRSVLVQIRNRIGTSAGMYILLLWALTGYPWMNRHSIVVQMSLLLGVLAVVAITIYAQIQRDEILSRTTETKEGTVDKQFFTKILGVVGVPALTLVASQFPEFSNLIFSWLEPGLSSMR